MKKLFTILFSVLSISVFSQERSPLTIVLSNNLDIINYDNSKGYTKHIKTPKQKGDSITLIEPFFSNTGQIDEIKTADGYTTDRELRGSISQNEFERYWAWVINKTQPAETTPFEQKQAQLQSSMKATSRAKANHEYLTIFTGDLELNFSHQRLLDFLAEYMNMGEKSNDFVNGQIISKCTERTAAGTQKTLTIKYKVRTENNYYFPTQVEITGTSESVIKFFVSYYPTKINTDERKPGEYVSYMLPDKATLTIDRTGGAKILITHND